MDEPVDPVWGYKLSEKEIAEILSREESSPNKIPLLEPLEEISPVKEDDMECFAEIREVLIRHGKLDRFGVTLLHSHFQMNPGEILIESTDQKNRTMTLEPAIVDTTQIAGVDTQWYLGNSMPLSLVKCRTSLHIEK
ncbi:hypothetical protein ACCS75_29805 [Rhizobium ruizarguesonis]